MSDRLFRCRASIDGKDRCGFEGDDTEAELHAAETGHSRCVVDGQFLAPEESRVCGRCLSRTRDAIVTIRDADLERVLEDAAERSGQVPANVLAMLAAGNTVNLRPYKPVADSKPVDVPHGGLVGSVTCWLPYWEHRAAADGREHYADHRGWNDPLVPFAELDSIAVSWHHALGEPRRLPVPDGVSPVAFLADYLLRRLWAAKNVAPDVDDDFPVLWRLADQVANTAGLVNHPETAPARCFDCGGALISPYREPDPIHDLREGRKHEGREFADGTDDPVPIWQCADRECARIYTPAEYHLALRAFLEEQAEAAG